MKRNDDHHDNDERSQCVARSIADRDIPSDGRSVRRAANPSQPKTVKPEPRRKASEHRDDSNRDHALAETLDGPHERYLRIRSATSKHERTHDPGKKTRYDGQQG